MRVAAAVDLVGEHLVCFGGEVLVHYTLDCQHGGEHQEVYGDAEDGEEPADVLNGSKAEEDTAHQTEDDAGEDADPEDGPFFSVGYFVADFEALHGRELLVQEEVDGKAPCDAQDDSGDEHESGCTGDTHAHEACEKEEVSYVLTVLLVEDGDGVDDLSAAHLDDCLVQADGGADVDPGDPDGKHIEDYHKDEGDDVLETIKDTFLNGGHYFKFLCHNVL